MYLVEGSGFFPDSNIHLLTRNFVLEGFQSNGQLVFAKLSSVIFNANVRDMVYFRNALYLFGDVTGELIWDTRTVAGPVNPFTFTAYVGKITAVPSKDCVVPCSNCCKDIVIGSVCFDSNTHKCASAVTLCGKLDEACGTICYNPSTHICNDQNFLEPN